MRREFNNVSGNNFNKNNIANIDKLIEEPMADRDGMFLDESGNGEIITPTKESRKICAKALLK